MAGSRGHPVLMFVSEEDETKNPLQGLKMEGKGIKVEGNLVFKKQKETRKQGLSENLYQRLEKD